MNFHSFQFAVFLVAVLVLYWTLANDRRARYSLLLLGSYVFYGAYEVWYLGLILFSTFLDYSCGRKIHESTKPRARRAWLLLSLAGNLGVLGFFKYTDWCLDILGGLLSPFGLHPDLHAIKLDILPAGLMDSTAVRILVPVGISFYTFQTLSYTIDIYRGLLKPARSLLDFALFVAFFPQLVAGPIVRAVDFLPQLELKPRFDRTRFHDGLYRMGLGLAKKVMLADVIGQYLVDPVFAQPDQYSWFAHVLCLYGFTFQIYFDFAGYSDIAIGTARMLGFDLPENFDLPYRSRSVREFWRRWHMTLASWVRDYVFFPILGKRGHRSDKRVSGGLMVTMITIGLWHGASVLWLCYGTLQGVVVVMERFLERRRGGKPFTSSPVRSAIAWTLTFHFIVLTCLFVRSDSMTQLWQILTLYGETSWRALAWYGPAALLFGAATHFMPPRIGKVFHERMVALPTPVGGIALGVIVGVLTALVVGETPYIYFAF